MFRYYKLFAILDKNSLLKMNLFEKMTLLIATGSFLTGIGTIIMAIKTNSKNNDIAKRQMETDKNIAKRQGVFDLHNAWGNINDLNVNQYITPDIISAINALSLTASVWNHDALEKELLYQSYWEAYKNLYDKLYLMTDILPGCSYTPKSKISPDITKAYTEMKQKEYFKTESTKI